MGIKRKSGSNRPFAHLGRLMKNKSLPVAAGHRSSAAARDRKPPSADPKCEHQLFREAMQGVEPIVQNKVAPDEVENRGRRSLKKFPAPCDSLQQLDRLLRTGEGFNVSATPEYREGTGPRVHPSATRLLHGGRFSIQAHIDLHGLTVPEATQAFDAFLDESIRTGVRAVLVIHGRGLSSPGRPVLKRKVHEWLTIGPWRKWVLAFASARSCDGGAGATYVLLRRRAITKRHRKSRTNT